MDYLKLLMKRGNKMLYELKGQYVYIGETCFKFDSEEKAKAFLLELIPALLGKGAI